MYVDFTGCVSFCVYMFNKSRSISQWDGFVKEDGTTIYDGDKFPHEPEKPRSVVETLNDSSVRFLGFMEDDFVKIDPTSISVTGDLTRVELKDKESETFVLVVAPSSGSGSVQYRNEHGRTCTIPISNGRALESAIQYHE